MGACLSSGASGDTARTLKLALLGVSGTGKSTFYKQLRVCHSDGFTQDEITFATTTLFANILFAVRDLRAVLSDKNIKIGKNVSNVMKAMHNVDNIHGDVRFNPEVMKVRDVLAKDKQVTKFLQDPANVGWSEYEEAFSYALESWDRVMDPNWVPSNDDILRLRSRTSGIVETSITVDKYIWHIVDAGGQKVERRKWPAAMTGLSGILFWVSLNDFDTPSEISQFPTKMHESLSVFQDLITSEEIGSTCVVLFLNKLDLYKKRVRQLPDAMKENWPKFKSEGGDPFKDGIQYFDDEFRSIVRKPASRLNEEKFYVHVTCALDTEQMRVVFSSIRDFVFKSRMEMSGL